MGKDKWVHKWESVKGGGEWSVKPEGGMLCWRDSGWTSGKIFGGMFRKEWELSRWRWGRKCRWWGQRWWKVRWQVGWRKRRWGKGGNWRHQCSFHWVVGYPGSIWGAVLPSCVWPHSSSRGGQGLPLIRFSACEGKLIVVINLLAHLWDVRRNGCTQVKTTIIVKTCEFHANGIQGQNQMYIPGA